MERNHGKLKHGAMEDMASGKLSQIPDPLNGCSVKSFILATTTSSLFEIDSGTRAIAFFTGAYQTINGIVGVIATNAGNSAAFPMVNPSDATFTTGSTAGANRFQIDVSHNGYVVFLIVNGDINPVTE